MDTRTGRLERWRLRLRGRWYRRRGATEKGMIRLVRAVPGWCTDAEASALYRAAIAQQASGDIAEIGSWKGRSTVALSLALQDARSNAVVYAIDPHEGSEEHAEVIRVEGTTLGEFRKNLKSYGAPEVVEEIVAPSVRAASVLAERGVRLSLVFIDGAHDEASVREDIRAFVPLLVPGGLLALHDYDPGWPGVMAAHRAELEPISEIVSQHDSLLITRLNLPAADASAT